MNRFLWIHRARGAAIILVLAWHAVSIPEYFGWEIPHLLAAVSDFFLPYRMPTLMFLSGLLLSKSFKKSLPQFYLGKVTFLLWPLLVWNCVRVVATQAPDAWPKINEWIDPGYLWFLAFILCYYAAAPLLRGLPIWAVPVAAVLGSSIGGDSVGGRLSYFAVFFFLGNCFSADHFPDQRWGRIPVIVAGFAAAGFGLYSSLTLGSTLYMWWSVPFSAAGILLIAVIAQRTSSRTPVARAVEAIGESSIVYYVAHFPIMFCVFLVFDRMNWPQGLAYLAAFCTAVAGCSLLAGNRKYTVIRWLFEMPFAPIRAPARS